MVLPVMVTVLLPPMFFVSNEPVADEVFRLTTSPVSLPASAAELVVSVAVVSALYVLLAAVMPVMVSSLAVMSPVVLGWVRL